MNREKARFILNIFIAVVVPAAWLWMFFGSVGELAQNGIGSLKYFAAAAVMLTFTVVVTFLGPLYGYINMFIGANLFFHGLVPLAAAFEIVFLCDRQFTKRENNIAVIAPLVYGTGYLINILINGMGTWPDTNDWYLFFAWGYPIGFVIYGAIVAVTWLLAFAMRKGQAAYLRKHR